MSQLPLDNWPASKTEVAYEFLLANIQQLEMICRGPLREIQTAISKNWPAILDEVRIAMVSYITCPDCF
jgi:hypothetical protein